MKKQLLFCILVLICIKVSSQSIVDVTETSFRLDGVSGEKILYYGFFEGDQIVINFQEKNGNPLKEFEVVELPSNMRYQEYKCTKIENKIVNVSRTGIYEFRLSNSALTGRICNLKIQRIPATEKSKDFNSTVFWKSRYDTTYIPHTEKYLIKSDTSSIEIYSSQVQLSSQAAINGNSNRRLVDFVLPENTISWSFYIGVGSEAKKEYERAITEFAQTASSAMKFIGPLASVALYNIPLIRGIQGEDNVRYYFLDNRNAELFNLGYPCKYYKGGDVTIEASQLSDPLKGKVFLGLMNDNMIETITIDIKVVAVVVDQEWGNREVKDMKIVETEVPYLVN